MKRWIFFFIAIQFSFCAEARQQANIPSQNDSGKSTVSIKDFSWIIGEWQGKIWDGECREVWTKASQNSLLCTFVYVKNNRPVFYELVILQQQNDTWSLQLKHFDGSLKGWEHKDSVISFPLLKVAKDAAFFEGLIYKGTSENAMDIILQLKREGKIEEAFFHMTKVK